MSEHCLLQFMPSMDKLMSVPPIEALRAQTIGLVRGPEVLELEPGTGLNLPFYSAELRRLSAVTLDGSLHPLARLRLATSHLALDVTAGALDKLPYPDGRFDTIVSTFMICVMRSLDRCVAEMRRVLKPGGRVVFLEHVVSDQPGQRLLQMLSEPLNRRVSCGCSLLVDPCRALERGGFQVERVTVDFPNFDSNRRRGVLGHAVKPG